MSDDKKVILVAEDSAPNRRIICQLLSSFGFEVIECVDGEDAYNKAINAIDNTLKLDAIVTDIMMPGMSGLEVIGQLKREDKLAGIPFLFLTAVAKKEHVVAAIKLGAKGYLLKPITREKLQKSCTDLFPNHKFPQKTGESPV
ncbi:MAG: response regulator [Opitutales bacterium]|nr:response regulator [Opitutales bacterium]